MFPVSVAETTDPDTPVSVTVKVAVVIVDGTAPPSASRGLKTSITKQTAPGAKGPVQVLFTTEKSQASAPDRATTRGPLADSPPLPIANEKDELAPFIVAKNCTTGGLIRSSAGVLTSALTGTTTISPAALTMSESLPRSGVVALKLTTTEQVSPSARFAVQVEVGSSDNWIPPSLTDKSVMVSAAVMLNVTCADAPTRKLPRSTD